MAGHAPGAAGADKSPKSLQSPMQQFQEKLAEKGLRLDGDPEGSLDANNPFALAEAPAVPPAEAPAAAPEAGAPPADAAQPGAAPEKPEAGATPAPAAAPAAGAPPTAAPPGAAVVDSATGAPVAASAPPELVDVEIDDPDTGNKFTVRAPKDVADAAKGGWMRRADYTRKTQELSRWKRQLEPFMVEDPQTHQTPLDAVLPYMQMANTNVEFARAMVTIANQIAAGQPASYGVAPPAAAAPAPAAPAPASTVEGVLQNVLAQAGDDLDPLAVDALRKVLPGVLGGVEREMADFRTWRSQMEQRDQTQRTEAERYQHAQRASQAFAHEARAAMQSAYPAEFNGTDADFARLGQIYDYAQRSGYVQSLGAMAGLFRAKADIDAAQREYTGSAAVAAVAARNLDTVQTQAQARAASDAVAAGLGGGSAGAAAGGVPTGPNTNFAKKSADGKPLTGTQFLKAFIAANPQ